MQAIVETVFDAVYLVSVITIGIPVSYTHLTLPTT